MSCLFGIVVYYTNEDDIKKLEKTIKSLQQIDYDKVKVKVVISSSHKNQYQNIVHLTNVIKETFPASEAIFHFNDDIAIQDTECFMKIIEATHFVKMNAGGTIKSDLFNEINQIVNKKQDLNSCVAVKTETGAKLVFDKPKLMFETDDAIIIQKELMQNHYLDFNNYDLATDYVRDLCIKQDKYEKI